MNTRRQKIPMSDQAKQALDDLAFQAQPSPVAEPRSSILIVDPALNWKIGELKTRQPEQLAGLVVGQRPER